MQRRSERDLLLAERRRWRRRRCRRCRWRVAFPEPVRQRGRGRWRGGRRRSVGGRRRSVAARDLRVNELAQWVHRGAQVRRGAGGGRGRGQREGAEGRESAGGRRGWQQACESMKVEQARLSASMSAESPRLAFWASEMAYSSCFSDGAPAARKPAARYATPLASLGTTSSLGTPPAASVSGAAEGRRPSSKASPGDPAHPAQHRPKAGWTLWPHLPHARYLHAVSTTYTISLHIHGMDGLTQPSKHLACTGRFGRPVF